MITPHDRTTSGDAGMWKVHAIGATVAFGLTALIYMMVIAPTNAQHDRALKERAAAKEHSLELAKLEASTRELESLARQMEKNLRESAELQPIDELNRRLAAISTLVEDSGLVLSQLSPGEVRSGSRFSVVPVRLQGAGTISGVTRLMHSLHETLRDVEVTSFSIQSRADGTGSVRFDMAMDWYTLAERANPGDRAGSAVAGAQENR